MDPDKVRDDLIDHAWRFDESWRKGHVDPAIEHAKQLSQLVRDLDEWFLRGGYLPERWRQSVGKRPS